jgi:chromosome partitioning protein
VVGEVRAHFGERVLTSMVPRSVRIAEAPGFGQNVLTYDPESRGAQAYGLLAEEVNARG